MKGRKPKPTAFRIIEGNREHRTIHRELEPRPKSARPPCPKFVEGQARKHWRYIIRQLIGMNTLGQSDQGTIMAAALAFGQISDLRAEIAEILDWPMQWMDEAQKELASKRRLLNNTANALVRFEAELGLNPTARTRIKLEKPEPQSRRERLLS